MQRQSASPPSRASLLWTQALILGLTLGCYWPALHGRLLWDDDAHVTRPGLQSAAGLARIWSDLHATQQFYPLLHSAFWIEHRLWGDATFGYHLANVLLHATAACLLVLILRRLKVPGACLAGLVFAVHPVCVESVAWISEQKNTLSLVFYLLATVAYLRFDRDRRMAAYLLASLFFACALLTKTVTATLPAALLVVFWWQRGGISWRRDVLPLVPWFALAATSGLFTSQVEKTIIGANGAGFDLTLVQRCLLAGRVIWFYLGKVLLPTHLVFFYPRWDVGSAAPGWTGFLVAAAAVTVALFLLRGRSRGPLAAWLFFVGSLFPALGFFNVYPFIYSYVADHFQYLACLGPVTLLSAGVAALLSRSSPAIRGVGWGLAAVLVATLGLMSNAQSRTYADPLALYTTTLARNPDCWMAHNNLGLLYDDQGASDKAIAEYEETLRLKPDLPRTHDNLGHAFARMPGRLNDAVAHYEEALRLKPDFAEAHNDLANVLAGLPGRLDEAIGHFGEAVRLEPDSAEIHNNLGNALAKAPGRLNGAVAEFEEALRLKPDFAGAHNSLGGVLGRMPGRLDEAIAHFQEALRLEPGFAEAHNNLGTAFLSVPGRLDDAVSQFKEALRLRPDFAEAHNNLGNALSKKPGRTDEAIAEYGEALRLRPDYGIARNNLGTALYAQGRAAEAVVQYQEALRLMPDYAEIRYNIAMALLSIPGRANEAAGQLEAFLQARPGNETARRMLAQIRANQP